MSQTTRPAGRPSKLTPERQEKIIELLRQGVPQETAARMAGLSPAALFKWKVRGEKALASVAGEAEEPGDLLELVPASDRPFVEFVEAVEAARAEAEGTYALVVHRAAIGGDVRAAMWWLDRAYPERWAQRQQMTVQQEGEVTVVIEGW